MAIGLDWRGDKEDSFVTVESLDAAQDALNRMARAENRGTGCYLTFEMIQSLSLTSIGQMWAQDDPRTKTKDAK